LKKWGVGVLRAAKPPAKPPSSPRFIEKLQKYEGIARDCPKNSTKNKRILKRILKIFVLFVFFMVRLGG
ncbi:MAG: hypothetical protein JXD18_12645, partial [Anaerolineae bacterium]|nr:hypothetical protein [Anaerolineae bacterium]